MKEGGEGVMDSVDDGEFFVGGEDAGLGELGGGSGAGGGGARGGGWGRKIVADSFGANEGVERVCHAFDLLDSPPWADLAKVQDGAISRGDEGVGVGIDRANTGAEFTVEELGEVAVGGKVGVCDFVEVDAKDVAVELEAGGADEDGEGMRVEPTPGAGEGFEGEGGEDLDLPGERLAWVFWAVLHCLRCEVEVGVTWGGRVPRGIEPGVGLAGGGKGGEIVVWRGRGERVGRVSYHGPSGRIRLDFCPTDSGSSTATTWSSSSIGRLAAFRNWENARKPIPSPTGIGYHSILVFERACRRR